MTQSKRKPELPTLGAVRPDSFRAVLSLGSANGQRRRKVIRAATISDVLEKLAIARNDAKEERATAVVPLRYRGKIEKLDLQFLRVGGRWVMMIKKAKNMATSHF